MKNQGSWMERLAEGMDLGEEPVPGQSVVEICGEHRVLIEHHRGVLSYGSEQICVRVGYGSVCVKGCGLVLAKMTREHLVIRGRIDSVCLMRREGK